MAVDAPFRFARANRWVHFIEDEDAGRVSHDVPFRDGISGEIRVRVIARTPLLVGGARRKGAPGEVWPFVSHDGHWAIPGTGIQGMIRSQLEVACFAKLGPRVAERRFGVRDLTGSTTAKELYTDRITDGTGLNGQVIVPQANAGWLIRSPDHSIRLVPCNYGRILFADIASAVRSDVAQRASLLDLLARTGEFARPTLSPTQLQLDQRNQDKLLKMLRRENEKASKKLLLLN